jgi:hypothetical protein
MSPVISNPKAGVEGQEKIILYPRRSKMFLIALVSLLFVCAGFFILSQSDEPHIPQALRIIISFLGIGFGPCFLYALYRIAVRQPALTLSQEGLLDNASGVSAGLVRWEEIERIYTSSLLGQQFVSISVKDPERFLQRMHGFKAKLMRPNIGLVGAPVNLPVTALGITSAELVVLIEGFRRSKGV